MPKFIVHHDGYFFEWSTIVDAPTTYGMRREEFEVYFEKRYGAEAMRDLPDRLSRALAQGTSSLDGTSAESLIAGNRAGPDETELPFADVIRITCYERPAAAER